MQPVRLWVSIIVCALAMGGSQVWAQVSVSTQHNDTSRTGQNVNETILTPALVSTQFGRVFSQSVDGQIYAQPLYLPAVNIPGQGTHNVVYIATEHDSVYAFDADAPHNTALWQVSFINPAAGINTVSTSDVGSSEISPEYGITGTPVIDTQSGTLYVVANTNESGSIVYRLHALDVSTGAEKFAGPVLIGASVPGTGDGSAGGVVAFNAVRHLQRPGLLLTNGIVYVGFGSHSDIDPYHGWLLAYNAQTLQQVGVYNATPNGSRGAIWQAGAGLASDALGNVYFSTGNGTFDATSSTPADFGDTIVKIVISGNNLSLADYFTPYNQAALATAEADLGSGGVLLLPDQPGPFPHLLVQAGKQGTIYLLNRDSLGHYNSAGIGDPQIVQELPNAIGSGNNNSEFGMPAYWNNNLYFWSSTDVLKTYTLTNGLLSTLPASTGTISSGVQRGPTPSISANGTTSGIIWALQTDAVSTNGPAVLYAFDATNVANVLYSSATNLARDNPGRAVKFTVPTVANGKVFVGTQNQLSVFGLTYSISGTIMPFAGGAGMTLSGNASATTTADAFGNYTFTGLADGLYSVTPSESGFAFSPASETVLVNGSSLSAVNFTASPMGSIAGTITNGSLTRVTLTGAASGTTTTDVAGNYNFSGLISGAYIVTPDKPGSSFVPSSQAVTVTGGGVTGVNFSARSSWSVIYVDSQETVCENGGATNAIDGNGNTKWVTQWCPTSPPMPHEIQINLGGWYTLNAFQYLARQDGCANGWIKDYEFYVSSDGANWGTPVAAGTFSYGNLSPACPGGGIPPPLQANFRPVTGQYIRLRALSEINGHPWTTAAEIGVLGAATVPPALARVSLSPSVVTGGTPSTGTVTLNEPAPAGGAVVALSSSKPSLVIVPASVTVPVGASTATFAISTNTVVGPTPVSIGGTYNGSQSATLMVNAKLVPQTGWSVVYVDSQERVCENGAATNAIDGNGNTKWVTQWCPTSPPTPHEIQIHLGGWYTLNALYYLARQDGCANGWIKDYEFYVSSDGANWGTPVAAGTFSYGNLSTACPGGGVPPPLQANFTPVTGQYIRLRALSEINANPWTTAAEIGVLGVAAAAPALAQIVVNPAVVASGSSSTGTVTLNTAAPANGAVVMLSSSNPAAATVPASVTIPAGASTATFTISTNAVSGPTPVSIGGTYNGSQSATLGVAGLVPQTGWSVLYVDSQERVCENGAATNAIDGNGNTKWVTQWCPTSPPTPHEIQIDLGGWYTLNAFQYLARQDGCANGWIKDYELYVSSDGANWGTPVAAGTFSYGNLSPACPGGGVPPPLQANFTPVTGQYIRLRALSEINGNPWTTAAEIGVLGVPASAPVVSSIALTPNAASVPQRNSLQFTAIGTFSDSSTRDLTAVATWVSSDPGTAVITSSGLATACPACTASTTITAQVGSVTSAPSILTVTAPSSVGCGATALGASQYDQSQCGNIGGSFPAVGSAITACGSVTATGTLTQDISAGPAANCLAISGGLTLNLGGHTVTGSVVIIGNPSNTHIYNGTITCATSDYCLRAIAADNVTGQLHYDHLTVTATETGTGGQAIYIDWSATSSAIGSTPSVLIEYVTVQAPPVPTSARTGSIWVSGGLMQTVIHNADLTCPPQANACQGVTIWGNSSARFYNNRVTLTDTTGLDQDSRGIICDGDTGSCQFHNNYVYAVNNRAFRLRTYSLIPVAPMSWHDNLVDNVISTSTGGSFHLGDPDSSQYAPSPIGNLTVLHNTVVVGGGGTAIFAGDTAALGPVVRDNVVKCKSASDCGSLARASQNFGNGWLTIYDNTLDVGIGPINPMGGTTTQYCNTGGCPSNGGTCTLISPCPVPQ